MARGGSREGAGKGKGLNLKQQVFVDHYLITGNATESARQAGYRGNDNTLGVVGHKLLRNAKVSEAIETRLAALHMSADEVLKRLADQARGSLIHFTRQEGDSVIVDLTAEEAVANYDLLKKIKSKVRTGTRGDDHYREVETEIEIHDAQSALKTLALHHKLLTEKHEYSGKDGAPIIIEYINDWRGTADTPAVPASGANSGTEASAAIQLAVSGETLAQDIGGDGTSG